MDAVGRSAGQIPGDRRRRRGADRPAGGTEGIRRPGGKLRTGPRCHRRQREVHGHAPRGAPLLLPRGALVRTPHPTQRPPSRPAWTTARCRGSAQVCSTPATRDATHISVPLRHQRRAGHLPPLYRGKGIPATLGQRRARFRESSERPWCRRYCSFWPDADEVNTAIVFRRGNSSHVGFRAGVFAAHPQRATRTLQNGWVVETSAPAVRSGILGDAKALVCSSAGSS